MNLKIPYLKNEAKTNFSGVSAMIAVVREWSMLDFLEAVGVSSHHECLSRLAADC